MYNAMDNAGQYPVRRL